MDHVKANDIAVGNDETDVPDGILKPCRGRKIAPLKLIIMSASLDARCFSEYFGGARALHVQGRQYPVDILYTTKPQTDYLDSAVRAIFQIHLDEAPGDILVFLTGQEEIESIEGLVREHLKQLTEGSQKLLVHPLFSSLPSEKQLKVFKRAPDGFRKVILATNIAEMSVTIPGIKYVIDPGLVKVRSYSPDSGIESLIVVKTSKPQALQRSGRAGREGPGECFRLYPESMFAGLDDSMVPEIKRCNLSNVILQLNALGVDDIIGFDFMEKPDRLSGYLTQLSCHGPPPADRDKPACTRIFHIVWPCRSAGVHVALECPCRALPFWFRLTRVHSRPQQHTASSTQPAAAASTQQPAARDSPQRNFVLRVIFSSKHISSRTPLLKLLVNMQSKALCL